MREVVELPMLHPEKFVTLGIDPPKGVLMYGPPGTGKTLLARAVANRTDACFIRVIGSELVQKYVGEGARMVRKPAFFSFTWLLLFAHSPQSLVETPAYERAGAEICGEGRAHGKELLFLLMVCLLLSFFLHQLLRIVELVQVYYIGNYIGNYIGKDARTVSNSFLPPVMVPAGQDTPALQLLASAPRHVGAGGVECEVEDPCAAAVGSTPTFL